MMNDDADTKPRVSAARWGLLRAALKGVAPETSDQAASIHRFPGFQLLSRNVIAAVTGKDDAFVQRLLQQEESEDVESLLWALHCCYSNNAKGVSLKLPHQKQEISEDVRANLASKGMLCRQMSGEENLQVWLPPNNDYACVDYNLSSACSFTIRVRERLPSPKINLQALTSQQHNDGVDNTGNTRVWDSETTLAFLLLQEPSSFLTTLNICTLWDLSVNDNEPLQVLELGAGMAGLAGLFLATINPTKTRVVLTDGHPDAVQNNRVNIMLNCVMNSGFQCDVTAERLVWTTDDIPQNTQKLDLVLASDCTHFQEFHACLALTITNQLRVGGAALLLQPPRGSSLEKFVECVNSCGDLVETYWLEKNYSETLTKLHQQYSEDDSYDPNIHYPHLLILRKLRPVTDSDREAVMQHMKDRESK